MLNEDVSVLFLWRPLKFSIKGEIWKVVVIVLCGDLSWEDLLDKLEDLSDRESEAWVVVFVVLDVADLLLLGLGICGTAVLSFLPDACSLLYSYARRDEV